SGSAGEANPNDSWDPFRSVYHPRKLIEELQTGKENQKNPCTQQQTMLSKDTYEELSSPFRRWFRQSSLEWRFQFAPQNYSKARTTVVQFTFHARSVSIHPHCSSRRK